MYKAYQHGQQSHSRTGSDSKRIAVIGAGVAGLTAAWVLHRQHDVTLFEKNDYLGGHTNTIDVPEENRTVAVDTGFIVYNERNYPNLKGLFKELGVATQLTDMSFSFSLDQGRLEYSGSGLGGLFAQKRNLLRPRHWFLLKEILRFNETAHSTLESANGSVDKGLSSGPNQYSGNINDKKKTTHQSRPLSPDWIETWPEPSANRAFSCLSLGEFLDIHGFSNDLKEHYLLPMGAAIWSCPAKIMLRFPALSFLQFFRNHGLVDLHNRPQWRTVVGGSSRYVDLMLERMGNRINIEPAALGVSRSQLRSAGGVQVRTARGVQQFDEVILACHADQSLSLLDDSSEPERQILGKFSYENNRTFLHTDTRLMPKRQAVWSSWNYLAESDQQAKQQMTASYWMNRLQQLDTANTYLVTLNPYALPRDEKIIREIQYQHPVFNDGALQSQRRLTEIQGQQKTWFCGSYYRYGFHEDAVGSAVAVCQSLGVLPDWYADWCEQQGRPLGQHHAQPVEQLLNDRPNEHGGDKHLADLLESRL